MKLLNITPLLLLAALPGFANTVYGAGDNNILYTVNPLTGATASVGNLGVTMYDIAEYGGKMYGLDSSSNLYSINTSTGASTEIGATGQGFNALTFNSSGVLYAAGQGTSKIYTINTSTGAATAVAGETNATADNSAGDIEFIGSTLYMTTQVSGNSILDTVNLATGVLTKVGSTDLGFTNVYGLTYIYGVLWGFTDNDGSSEVIRINTTTGVGTAVVGYGGTGRGAFGFDGTTDDAAPEPGTLGVMALGMAGLAGVAYRRRKA